MSASFAGKTLTQTFTLAKGQFIDFSVDHNGARECPGCVPRPNRFNLYDSTNYVATVSLQPVPEPSSALLLAAGRNSTVGAMLPTIRACAPALAIESLPQCSHFIPMEEPALVRDRMRALRRGS